MSNAKLIKNDDPDMTVANRIDPKLYRWLDNDFVDVDKTHDDKLFYTKDAYVAMAKYIFDEGMTAVEAYRAMGFDPDILGADRANAMAQRAKKLYEEDEDFTARASNYDGSIAMDQMPHLSPKEKLAYMEARIAYLETVVEVQKKIESALEQRRLLLKSRKP